MTSDQHTPTPWLVHLCPYDHQYYILDSSLVACPQNEANTRFIVHAVNTHEAMLDALQAAVARIEIANREGDPILSAWLPQARAAITAAQEHHHV